MPIPIAQNKNVVLFAPSQWMRAECLPFGAFGFVFLCVVMNGLVLHADEAGIEFFEKSVRPILVQHCYECHAAGENNGGLLLDSKIAVAAGGDSGSVVVAGQPDESLLIEAVRYRNRDLQMPPQNRLSDSEIAALEKWVQLGAPDPREAIVQSPGNAPTGMSIEDGRKFWSMQPVSPVSIPDVSDPDWVRTPIDAFILAKLESQNLVPASTADKGTLLRRVTYDLIGLPPTESELRTFLADESDDAFSTVVERLLKSEHYGVPWGRHWLDVARYADSNGLDENLAFGNAWRYRDYVVDSFNNDKPFDRFLTEQIAGDLLPDADLQTRTGTGFLLLGAKVLAEPDLEKLLMDTVDEQIDTVGKVFMGLTLGCVRCHDHKFDPIKQNDYYAMAAIFKSTRTFAETRTGAIKHWHEHSFATDEEKERLKVVDEEIKAKKSAATKFKNEAFAKIRKEAKAHATEYLMAATLFDVSAPLSVVEDIAAQHDLHPRILHHCRTHLVYHQDAPLFAEWDELAVQGMDAVEQHYRPLFTGVSSDPQVQLAKSALNDLSGFLAVPPKPGFAFDTATLAEYNRLEEEARIVESAAPDESAILAVAEEPTLTELPIHIRGSHLNLGEPVERAFPEVMRRASASSDFPADQSGRLQLARWLASPDHPLTARVLVNRIWGWHFGRGLVSTSENFGRLGQRPSHSELLDWLAVRFVESGWSIKQLHRLILSSNVYQMQAIHPADDVAMQADPENRLLWKFPVRRLQAEQLRDAMLFISGRLDMQIGGKTVPLRNRQFVFNHTSEDHTKYDSLRRALYLPIIRNNLYTMFEQFDFPDPTMPTGRRNATVVAPQALLLMNSDLVMDSASSLATDVLSKSNNDAERIAMLYRRCFSRNPTQEESEHAIGFLGEMISVSIADKVDSVPATKDAWSLLCQSFFASNEFLYLK